MVDMRVLIDGELRGASSGESIEVTAPSTGASIGRIPRGDARDIDAAVAAARRAFENTWGDTAPAERGRWLGRLSQAITAEVEALTELEALDTGKPLVQARKDIEVTARYFEYYGALADKIHGETIPFDPERLTVVLREPHGVTGHIIPWNYPAQMTGRTLGPALAAGNATVLKPGEDACLSVLRIGELATEIGFPRGAINIVPGTGEEAGAALSSHPDVDFLTFTGSPEVGSLVQSAAGKNHRGCVLELGGKSPQILFEDCDLDAALPVVLNGIVQNGGQTCAAGSRVLIDASIYDEVIERLGQHFSSLRVGPHDSGADCGALISRRQLERVRGFVARAQSEGVPVVATADLPASLPAGGYYCAPQLFGPVPTDSFLAQEEVFGPVLAAMKFEGEREAVRIANDTPFGLVAGVWTRDGARQMRVAKALRCGQVFVNGYGAGGGVELPFGGVKRSGHGREKGVDAVREFTVTKTVVFDHGRN